MIVTCTSTDTEHEGPVVAVPVVASDVGAVPSEPGMPPGTAFAGGTYAGSAGPDVPCVFGGVAANGFAAACARGVILCVGGGVGFGSGVLTRVVWLTEKTSGLT